jgi:hypothetical protein
MRWEEVQERFPNEWVVLEATKAHSSEGQRYIEEVVVISLENFQVEIGNMDYGMEINGIIGFDFISAANLLIDTKNMLVYPANSSYK